MFIRQLRLRQFRNYGDSCIEPSENINLLCGLNAQGKSNLLESIYLLTTTRSLRASRESEMIRHSEECAAVSADLARDRDSDLQIEIQLLQGDKKSVRINGVKRPRVLDAIGLLNSVHFSSTDLSLVAGEPAARRRYLNIEISQISPKYVFDLANYKKALEQRNRLLRDMRERGAHPGVIEAWSDQLVQHGAPLIEKRRFYLDRLNPLANAVHQELTEGAESLAINYMPSVSMPAANDAEGFAAAFRVELERVCSEEMRRGITLVGPQRDDLAFEINGLDARAYGSQGQQRTVVLSLKLAQLQLMTDYVGEPPLMLLDDVMSDLDDCRRAQLLSRIRQRCQTFITCTSLRDFPPEIVTESRIYDVVDGAIKLRGD